MILVRLVIVLCVFDTRRYLVDDRLYCARNKIESDRSVPNVFSKKLCGKISYLIFNNGRSALTKYNPFVYQIYNNR